MHGEITNEFRKTSNGINSKFITYLRPNNGITEAELGSNLSASDAIRKEWGSNWNDEIKNKIWNINDNMKVNIKNIKNLAQSKIVPHLL